MRLLRGIVNALGRSKRHEERHYVIKFSSAAILAMPLIQRAFQGVPWAFLYREPLEILGAQLGRPGDPLPPGLAQAGLLEGDPAEIGRMRAEEFWTRVLASRYASATDAVMAGNALLLNYSQLPAAVWESLAPFFGLICGPEDPPRMRQVARFNAKDPSKYFVDDGVQRRRVASAALGAMENAAVLEHYRRLESIRAAAGANRPSSKSCASERGSTRYGD